MLILLFASNFLQELQRLFSLGLLLFLKRVKHYINLFSVSISYLFISNASEVVEIHEDNNTLVYQTS